MPQSPTALSASITESHCSYGFIDRQECPVCGSADPITVFRGRFDSGAIGAFVSSYYPRSRGELGQTPYELRRCPHCSLVYQRFAGDDRLLGDLYGKWINDSRLPEQDRQYRLDLAAPLLSRDGHELLVAADYLKISPHEMRVLDYGMGWALWSRIARQLGCDCYGHELVKERLAYGKSHGIQPIATRELGRPMFDFINTEQVLEHLRDLTSTASTLAGSLRPGGILKVSVPNAERAMRIVGLLQSGGCRGTIDEIMPVQPLEHVNSFTRRALAVLAETLGLTIVCPSIVQRYAFLKRRGTLSFSHPKKALKELVRPLAQRRSGRNLYVWMRKPA